MSGRCDTCGDATPGRRARYVEPPGVAGPDDAGVELVLCGDCLSARIDALLGQAGALIDAVRDSGFGDDPWTGGDPARTAPQPWGDVDHLRALGELRVRWLGRGPERR